MGILSAGSSLAVFWFWLEAVPLIIAGEFRAYTSFIMPIAGLIFAASFFALAAIFIKSRRVIYPAAVIGMAAPYLLAPATNTVIGSLAASVLLIVFAVHRLRKEFTLSLGFSVSKTVKAGLPLYFTVASLIVSVFYLVSLPEEKAVSALLPRSAFDVTLQSLSGPLKSLTGFPITLRPEATVDETLFELARDQLKSRGIPVAQLPKTELGKILSAQRLELEKQYGIKLGGQEKIADVFYNALASRLAELPGPYRQYLPLASALAFFFAFKALTFPLYYVTLLILYFLIKLLVLTKILKTERQEITVERLTL